MSNTLRSLNVLLVLLTFAASIWAWVSLPELETYPVHWNIHGEADGFGSKTTVFFVLAVIPLTALFTHGLLWLLSRLSALKEGLEKSGKAYDITWHATLWLLLGINIIIAVTYMTFLSGEENMPDMNLMMRFMPIALGSFFIVVGNLLTKFRQNYFVGVKTPWTLKSKSTWEATHRFTAKLWVGAGVAIILVQFFVPADLGLIVAIVLLLGSTLLAVLYSYLFYQTASDKLQ